MLETFWSVKYGVMEFLPSDYLPIPYTDSIWIPKNINREQLTVWTRYYNRKGLDLRMFGTNTPEQAVALLRQRSPEINTRERRNDRIAAAKKCNLLNKYAVKFQEKLWLTEPLPDGIQGSCTMPEQQTTTILLEEISS
tara:strand:+ start:251 stop:664 length:414 start_codon:yes stop_codon:yes gene_type:complete